MLGRAIKGERMCVRSRAAQVKRPQPRVGTYGHEEDSADGTEVSTIASTTTQGNTDVE